MTLAGSHPRKLKPIMAAKKVATESRRGGSEVWKDHDPPINTAVYEGGGEELVRLVEDVKAGRPLRL